MSEPVAGQVKWDFFVSYAEADRGWAEWIAWQLEDVGFRVLLQAWDFVPGSNWISTMHAGVQHAIRTVVVLSPTYLSSVFGAAEWQAAWKEDPDGSAKKLLPVRVAECKRLGLLAGVVSVDVFGIAEAEARGRLHSAVTVAIRGRDKPIERPLYPDAHVAQSRSRAVLNLPRFPVAPPKVWNVPARNPNFTGRNSDLDRLHAALTSDRKPTVCSLHGMGGVGKTQTAIEYIHRQADNYDLVWWINAEEAIGIGDQFVELGHEISREIELDEMRDVVPDVGVMVRSVHRALRDMSRWLLVFDNTETPRDVEYLLPPAGPGQVLITTRRDGFRALGDVLDLDVLERADSITMLQRRAPDLTRRDAIAISQRLDDLPLALAQAAAYLDQSHLPASEYLRLLETRAADLHSRGRTVGHPHSIATIWSVSLDQLRAIAPAAVQLLTLCAWLAPEPVPLDLFSNHAALLPAPLNATADDPIAFVDAVADLVDYSLARRTGNDILVHRLVQDVIREDDRDATGSPPLDNVLILLRADLPAEIDDKPPNWPRWRQLLRHVLVATGHQQDPNSTTAADATWLLDRAGNYFYVHGRPVDAVHLLERALHFRERIDGTSNSEIATTLKNLGLGLADLKKPDSAVEYLEHALRLLETADQPDGFAIADILNYLGWAHVRRGQPATALPIYERALNIRETADRPDPVRVAADLNGLGRALADIGRPAEALPLHERALQLCEAVNGPDHPWVGTTLSYWGHALTEVGRPAEALPLLERAFNIRETAYGSDHPWLATVLNHRGRALTDLGRLAEALALHERALKIHEAAYGPDHPDVASDLDHMSRALYGMGRHDEAVSLSRRVVRDE